MEHYLDVQFRLLREDFVAPLRDGIMQYNEALQSGETTSRNRDIRLYFDVYVKHSVCTEESGLVHCIQFDTEPLTNIIWDTSKRLLHGSLLCLSSNNFQTVLFASVVDRKSDLLEEGILYVKFEEFDMVADVVTPRDTFVMAESSAFFEAYRHVLKGLQCVDDSLPFQEYIVHCDIDVKHPKYMSRNMKYDFQTILPCPESSDTAIDGPCKGSTNRKDVLVRRSGVNRNKCCCLFPVLSFQLWPKAENLMLDNSQMEALHASLTKEFVIIQGPPGTGKTHLGLKIARMLLHNKSRWLGGNNRPMLVVCFTNHALDQFLEGIVKCVSDVIRVGTRCQNVNLYEYNIKHSKIQDKYIHSVPDLVRQGLQDTRKTLEELDKELKMKIATLKATYIGVLNEDKLKEHISQKHFLQLTEHVPYEFRQKQMARVVSMVLEWLGLGSVKNMIPKETDFLKGMDDVPKTVVKEVEGGYNTDIAEDPKLETLSRMLDICDEQGVMEKYEKIQPDFNSVVLSVNQLQVPYEDLDMEKISIFDAKEMNLRLEWLKAGLHQPHGENTEQNLWKLKMEDRWKLYRFWVHGYRTLIEKKIKETEQKFQIEQERQVELKNRRIQQ